MDALLEQLKQQSQQRLLDELSVEDAILETPQESTIIRAAVRDQVDSILWLDNLKEEDAEYKRRLEANRNVKERCMICTLPWGTCIHTKEWVAEKQAQREDQEFREKTNLDQQINDVLNVLDDMQDGIVLETNPVIEDIDIHNMQWTVLEQRATDKIGHTEMCLFSPDERGWHTTTKLSSERILTFGGFKFRNKEVPQPFKAVPLSHEVEYLNDLRVYNAEDCSWKGVKATGQLPVNYGVHNANVAQAHAAADAPPSPEGRYGHIAAALDKQRLLIFSGRGEGGRVLNDTWVYHCDHDAWQLVQTNEALRLPVPPPRYFSAACSVFPDDSNLQCDKHGSIRDVLGISHNQRLGQSYSFTSSLTADELLLTGYMRRPSVNIRRSDPSKENIGPLEAAEEQQYSEAADDDDTHGAGPSADVYLFGGTDGIDNFGDLWVFRGHPKVMKWERLVAVGLPPCPRYGHEIVVITGWGDFKSTPMQGVPVAGSGQQLMIIGGCSVSPQGEMVGTNLGVAETKALMAYGNEVRRNYRNEEKFAAAAGQALESTILLETETMGLEGVYKMAADASGVLHRIEQQTRIAEQEMVDRFKISAGNMQYNIKQARHPNPLLDSAVLNISDMIWRSQVYPPIRGQIPRCRMHFGACCIGNFVFVMGGAEPTALRYNHVEEKNTLVYVLNLQTMIWEQPTAVNSEEYMKEAMSIADADIIRAYSRCDEEKSRGMSLGALNGRTIELCEAEAVLEVCKWRKSVLEKEKKEEYRAPSARWGATLLSLGQRMIYVGGWEELRAVPKGMSLICNVEHEHERRRRLEDEVKARLERERLAAEAEARMQNVQSVFELRAKRREEAVNREREGRRMRYEEILSSLPPLFKPDAVELVKANQRTIWVRWARLNRNSNRELIDDTSVTYFLYMRSGFENYQRGDRVYVTARPDPKKLEMAKAAAARSRLRSIAGKFGDFSTTEAGEHSVPSDTDNFDSELAIFDDKCKRFPAEITRLRADDSFDIIYDDGTIENSVPRRRLKMAPTIRYSAVPLEQLRNQKPVSRQNAVPVDTPVRSESGSGNRATASTELSGSAKICDDIEAKNDTAAPEIKLAELTSLTSNGASAVAVGVNAAMLVPYSMRGGNEIDRNLQNCAQMNLLPSAVVPLELAGTVRSRIKQRVMKSMRATERLEEFRGITAEMRRERNAPKKKKVKNVAAAAEMRRRMSSRLRQEDLDGTRKHRRKSSKRRLSGASSKNSGSVAPSVAMSKDNFAEDDELNISLNLNVDNSVGGSKRGTSTGHLSRSNSYRSIDSTTSNGSASGTENSASIGPERPVGGLRRDRSNVSFLSQDSSFSDDGTLGSAAADDGIIEEQHNNLAPPNLWGDESTYCDPFAKDHPPLTVMPDDRWRLVYAGNDTTYSCTGIVSDDALARNPSIRVPVAFLLQVHGVDKPLYERSQLSNPAIFFTKAVAESSNNALIASDQDPLGNSSNSFDDFDNEEAPVVASPVPQLPVSPPKERKGKEKEPNPINIVPKGISKTKKEIISALLSGQTLVDIEKRNNVCVSYGVGEDFI